jgi:transaldolase
MKEIGMKFFLDSAIAEEIQYALETLAIDGITTNPRHVQVSGKPFLTAVQEIGTLVKQYPDVTVSVQTNPHNHNDYKAIVTEAQKFAAMSDQFVIKMPCTEDGFRACKILASDDIRCNLTLCFSSVQALQAMRIGAFYVSPFVGWKETNGEETRSFIEECVAIRDNYGFTTGILVAAVRNGRQIADSAVAGADIVTAGLAVYKEAFTHPYTDMGLGKFQEFWDATPYGEAESVS